MPEKNQRVAFDARFRKPPEGAKERKEAKKAMYLINFFHIIDFCVFCPCRTVRIAPCEAAYVTLTCLSARKNFSRHTWARHEGGLNGRNLWKCYT